MSIDPIRAGQPTPAVDVEVPRLLDAAERSLARDRRGRLARPAVLAGVAALLVLGLPWTYGRRIGVGVWQAGYEQQPVLVGVALAGVVAAVLALLLPDPRHGLAAAVATALAAGWYLVRAAQVARLGDTGDTWPGPGPSVGTAVGIAWLLTAAGIVWSIRRTPVTGPSEYARRDAVRRLRSTRDSRPVSQPDLGIEVHPRE